MEKIYSTTYFRNDILKIGKEILEIHRKADSFYVQIPDENKKKEILGCVHIFNKTDNKKENEKETNIAIPPQILYYVAIIIFLANKVYQTLGDGFEELV